MSNTDQRGAKTLAACKQVAQDWRDLAHAIREEDAYASHVKEETKQAKLEKMLAEADRIEQGHIDNFTIAQRVDFVLTGVCKPLLPPAAQVAK